MKKLRLAFMVCSVFFVLAACGGKAATSEKDEKAGKTDVASIVISKGEYIIPDDKEVSEDEGYLALEVTVKNESKKSLNVSSGDISLYDENDSKVEPASVYSEDESFKLLGHDNLSADKSKTGYLVFKVDQDSQYELHFEPQYYDVENMDKEIKDVVLKIDTAEYKDTTEEPSAALTAFIDEVFLAKENEKYDTVVANNKEATAESFDEEFTKALSNFFSDYEPTNEELHQLVESFKTSNGKVAEVDQKLLSVYPNSATIQVKPKALSFDNMDDEVESLMDKYIEENKDKEYSDYQAVYVDAEKYLLENLPEVFSVASPTELDTYGDGYRIQLKKTDDKWEVDTVKSSSNNYYEYLEEAFRGGLYK